MTFEQNKNSKALAWTVGIHALLLLGFMLVKYSLPAMAPSEDLGLEVNLGTSEDGFGDDQPENTEDPAAAENTVAVNTQNAATEEDNRAVHTSDEHDAPAVVPAKPVVKKERKPVTVTQPQQVVKKTTPNKPATTAASNVNTQPQSKKYVYAGASGKGGNSAQTNRNGGSEGIGQGTVDMGVPGGTPGAANYSGTPGGGGTTIGHSLSGRNIVARPDPKAEFNEGGKVVIRATVNRDGEIVNTRVVSASNPTLRAIALKKIQSVRFNKSADAPNEQFGNITFSFKTTRK